jgi:hypothetical protein
MQDMWSVLRENGQMSNLQGALPTEMVSFCNLISLILKSVIFFAMSYGDFVNVP